MPKDDSIQMPDAAALGLMQALTSNGDDPEALLKTLATNAGSPTTSMLASLLMNNMSDDDDDEDDDLDGDFAEIDRLLAFAEDDTIDVTPGDNLDGEVEALREVNDTLATALGACPHCWGGDAGCNECHGTGEPGTSDPDPHLFSELILPAVRRINQSRSAMSRSANASQKTATKEVQHGRA